MRRGECWSMDGMRCARFVGRGMDLATSVGSWWGKARQGCARPRDRPQPSPRKNGGLFYFGRLYSVRSFSRSALSGVFLDRFSWLRGVAMLDVGAVNDGLGLCKLRVDVVELEARLLAT